MWQLDLSGQKLQGVSSFRGVMTFRYSIPFNFWIVCSTKPIGMLSSRLISAAFMYRFLQMHVSTSLRTKKVTTYACRFAVFSQCLLVPTPDNWYMLTLLFDIVNYHQRWKKQKQCGAVWWCIACQKIF